MEKIIKIGPVELYESEAERLFNEGRYIVTYSKIYQLVKRAGRVCGHVIFTTKGMTRRGRYFALTERDVAALMRH